MPLAIGAVMVGAAALAAVLFLTRRPAADTSDGVRPLPVPTAAAAPATAPPAAALAPPTAVPAAAPTEEARVEPTAVPRRPTPARERQAPTAAAALPTSVNNLPQRAARFPPQCVQAVPLDLAPEIAARHRGESIGLIVTVGEDGAVKKATVISEVCPECDRAALEAVKKFQCKPARDAEDRPVEATIAIPIRL